MLNNVPPNIKIKLTMLLCFFLKKNKTKDKKESKIGISNRKTNVPFWAKPIFKRSTKI